MPPRAKLSSVKLQSLTANNFMPFKGKVELTFPLEEQRNVMIVFGDNMRGKTSILNAIRWAFYGEALGRHTRTIPLQEIVNKDAVLEDDWKLEVQVRFDANGHDYDLRRVANRRKLVAEPSRPEDFAVEVFMTRDGLAVPGDQIEAEIATIAPKQVSRFFLFDGELLQEYETLLIEESQQGSQIKEAIEQVLGVPALTNGRVDTQTILKQAQKRQTADLKQIAGLEKHAKLNEQLTVKIDAIDRDLQELQEKLRETRQDRMTLGDEIESAQAIYSATAALNAKKEKREFLTKECDKKESERLDLLSEAWKDLLDNQLQLRRAQLERQREELVGSIRKRSGLEKRIDDLQQLLDTRECPICAQELLDENRSRIGRALGEAESELLSISDSSAALQEISGRLDALSNIRGIHAKDRLQQAENDLQGFQVQLTQVQNEIEELKDEIAGYDTAELARKRVLHDNKIKEEGNLQRDIQHQIEQRKALNDDLALSQAAIEGLTKDRTQRSTVRVTVCSNLERVFTQSIEQLRDRLLERVEELASAAFKQMTTQKKYRGLEINKNYGLQIVDESGRYVAVRSAGAEQVVALSLIDGLNRTGRSAGPVIMDTPFGRLDLRHRNNILRYLPSVTSQFVLLVHGGEVRKETDLDVIADKIGATYEIEEISSTQSRLVRTTL